MIRNTYGNYIPHFFCVRDVCEQLSQEIPIRMPVGRYKYVHARARIVGM